MFIKTQAHKDIEDAVLTPDGGNVQISACAGAGKTSTLVELLKGIDPAKRVLFLAFNRKIVDELIQRVPAYVQVATLNALGHRALLAHLQGTTGVTPCVDANKVRTIAKDAFDSATERTKYLAPVTRLVRLAKSAGIVPEGCGSMPGLVQDTSAAWLDLITHHDLDVEGDVGRVVDLARAVLAASCKDLGCIDYDDQLLLTYALGAPIYANDFVFVDEAQDLSPLQHALVRRTLGERGRLVAVGDPHQAIYGFRGADAQSMTTLAATFACRELPLHVSYRCPQAVVRLAQQYVPHIQPHADAPEGTVYTALTHVDKLEIAPGDMVVSRTSAPCVKVAHSLLRKGVPAVVLGRDIGAGLLALSKVLKPKTLDEVEANLDRWQAKELEKSERKGDDAKAASVNDRAETLRVFADMSVDLQDLEARINSMFADDRDASGVVTICTIHKAKGLEANRVVLLNPHKMPSKWAKQDWQRQQEVNLMYVAITRAKQTLTYAVTDEDQRRSKVDRSANERCANAKVKITGNTYPVRNQLAALGGEYDAAQKVWFVPAEHAEHAQRLAASTPFRRRRY